MNAQEIYDAAVRCIKDREFLTAQDLLTMFKTKADQYPNLLVQYDQLKRQFDLAKW